VPTVIEQLSDQESLRSGPFVAYRGGLRGEAGLNRLEEVTIDDRRMLAWIAVLTMVGLSVISAFETRRGSRVGRISGSS
jgi:hypothetical protein